MAVFAGNSHHASGTVPRTTVWASSGFTRMICGKSFVATGMSWDAISEEWNGNVSKAAIVEAVALDVLA